MNITVLNYNHQVVDYQVATKLKIGFGPGDAFFMQFCKHF